MWSAAVSTYGSFQTVVSFSNSDEHWYPLGTKISWNGRHLSQNRIMSGKLDDTASLLVPHAYDHAFSKLQEASSVWYICYQHKKTAMLPFWIQRAWSGMVIHQHVQVRCSQPPHMTKSILTTSRLVYTLCWSPYSNALVIFSPSAQPREPPKKPKLCVTQTTLFTEPAIELLGNERHSTLTPANASVLAMES